MFGNHGLGGLLEEGAHEKSPKCLGGNLGDFGGILQRSRPDPAGGITQTPYIKQAGKFDYQEDAMDAGIDEIGEQFAIFSFFERSEVKN